MRNKLRISAPEPGFCPNQVEGKKRKWKRKKRKKRS
jgi:hypothetical protein